MFKKNNLIILSILFSTIFFAGSNAYAAKHSTHLNNIKSTVKKVFPNETINVQYVDNAVLLTGNVTSADVAQKIEKLTRALTHDKTKILNFMNLKTSQQVLLRVKIAQVDKTSAADLFANPQNIDSLKMIAEPNLVAMSGESAEFMSGGEIPMINADGSTYYKPYGIKVRFSPKVISPNLIRINVAPEMFYMTNNSTVVNGASLPYLSGNKTNTTVEMAPGESFMISGLVLDTFGDLPEKMLREVVVSVTPFIVDPVHNADVSLPTDVVHVPNQMEMKFMDNVNAKSSLKVDEPLKKQNLSGAGQMGLEGPVGFVTE